MDTLGALLDFVMEKHGEIMSQNGDTVAIWRCTNGMDASSHLVLKSSASERHSRMQVISDMHPVSKRGFLFTQNHELTQLLIMMIDGHS